MNWVMTKTGNVHPTQIISADELGHDRDRERSSGTNNILCIDIGLMHLFMTETGNAQLARIISSALTLG